MFDAKLFQCLLIISIICQFFRQQRKILEFLQASNFGGNNHEKPLFTRLCESFELNLALLRMYWVRWERDVWRYEPTFTPNAAIFSMHSTVNIPVKHMFMYFSVFLYESLCRWNCNAYTDKHTAGQTDIRTYVQALIACLAFFLCFLSA